MTIETTDPALDDPSSRQRRGSAISLPIVHRFLERIGFVSVAVGFDGRLVFDKHVNRASAADVAAGGCGGA